jgi:hypothetical protein
LSFNLSPIFYHLRSKDSEKSDPAWKEHGLTTVACHFTTILKPRISHTPQKSNNPGKPRVITSPQFSLAYTLSLLRGLVKRNFHMTLVIIVRLAAGRRHFEYGALSDLSKLMPRAIISGEAKIQ